MRAFIAGLCVLCSACADGGATNEPKTRLLAAELDGGTDGGSTGEPCNWFVYWLTMMDVEGPCNWGKISKDPATALFRTNGGECLAPATICGIAACSDLTYIREKQVVEVWGPAGLDDGTVWAATESFDCE